MFYSEFHFKPSQFSMDFHVVNNSVRKTVLTHQKFFHNLILSYMSSSIQM
eukprot:UN22486